MIRLPVPFDRVPTAVGHHKLLFLRFLVTSVGRSVLAMAAIFLIRDFLSAILGEGQGLGTTLVAALGTAAALWTLAGLLAVASIGSSLLGYDNKVVQQRIVAVLELGLMERLFHHLLTLSVQFFDRTSQGDLIQALRRDVARHRGVVIAYANLVLEGSLAIGLLIVVVSLSPTLALWAFLVLPMAALPIIRIARRILVHSRGVRRKGYVLFDVILQLLGAIRVIKVYRREKSEAQAAVGRAREYFAELVKMVRVRSLAEFTLESIGALSIVVVIVAGGFQVMAGTLSWPSLLAFVMGARALHGPLGNFNSNYMEIKRHGAAVERLRELLTERPSVRDTDKARRLSSAPEAITVDELAFAYDDKLVLQEISFDVRAGETVGIVGPSGAGKTTLLNLIARFYDPTVGAVRVDGRDLKEYRLADLYDKIAIVTQDPFLFTSSVRDNIRCGRPEATDAEVERAARAAEVHDEIETLPNGYDTVVGGTGRTLSRGQAQRINVARAIVKNAPVVLLDEATSSLDFIAAVKVQRAIEQLARGRTTFVVAHRLSTLRDASKIVVLENGRCRGVGTHDELVAGCLLYRRMWDAQELDGQTPAERQPQTVQPR